jgi:hypothetical protein
VLSDKCYSGLSAVSSHRKVECRSASELSLYGQKVGCRSASELSLYGQKGGCRSASEMSLYGLCRRMEKWKYNSTNP